MGYDYDLVYKRGSENTVADALSRRDAEVSLLGLSVPTFPFMTDLLQTY